MAKSWNVINLSEKKLEEIAIQVCHDIKDSDQHYESEIEPNVMKRRESYESDPSYYEKKFPKLSKITDLTSSDVADTIEWSIPSLMRTFFGGEDVVTLQGVTEEDDDPAATMQELINYQLMRHNNAFMVFHDWFKNALIENVGVLKCYWERSTKVDETYEIYVNQEELTSLQETPGVKVTHINKKDADLFRIEYDVVSIVKNQPIIEAIPVSELRYSKEAKSIDVADFVSHRKVVSADYLKRKEKDGVYGNITKALEDAENVQYTQYEQQANPALNLLGNPNTDVVDKARKKLVIYECYTKLDVNDDDLLEDVIIHIVNSTIVRIDYNTMGRHPFFLLSPIRDPQKVWAKKGICDLLSQLQDLKTALLRQIVYNVAISNDKQAFVNVDMLVDVREFIDGKKAVRVQGDPRQAVYWMPIEPLPPQVFSFLEYIEGMKEARTGITRYNQGMDANSLNKTATGINQIMQASNQRLELIARMFAETGINQLFRHLIRLNQQFIDNAVVIRITNKSKTVSPDDLQGEIDIIVNAGMGAGGKATILQNIQSLIALYPQLIEGGIAGPEHVSYVIGKMIEEMGWKNKEDFAYTPEQILQKVQQAQQQQQEMQEKQQQMMQEQAQQQMQNQQAQLELQANDQQHRHGMDEQKHELDKEKIIADYVQKAKAEVNKQSQAGKKVVGRSGDK